MKSLCGTILAAAVVGGTFAASAAPEVSWSIMHPTGIDVKYMERVAAKAAEYGGVDSFEVCGPCHSPDGGINGLSMLEPYPKAHARVDAAAVEAARAKLNAIVAIAHEIGKPLYYWHREIFLQPGIIEDLPQMLDEDGEFDLLGSTYQDYLRFKIEEAFKFVPGLDGIVLTLTEADYSVIHNSNPERYPPAKVVEAIARIFAEEHAKRGKKFILRSFGSIPKDYEDIIAGAVAVAGDYTFEIETKVTQADFVPWLPKNSFLKRNPPLTLGAECDGVGEYLGAGYLPSVQVSRIHGYVADAREEGADRFTIRIDRVGNSIFDTAAEANLYAYMRFIKDPAANIEGVLAEYVRNLHYVASNLTFHTFPIRPDFKYVKAGGIFGAYHENADLSNCRGSWSMLYWQKAPTHEQILAEKAKGRMEFLASVNTDGMSDDERKNHAKFLKLMGRPHTFEEAKVKVELAKMHGFTNISCDLIYGLPTETLEDVKQDVVGLLSLNVPHLSTYCLSVNPGTVWHNKGYKEMDDGDAADQYDLILSEFRKAGYKRYEVSNFSKPGYESRHNLVYWRDEEYYAAGLGASGYLNGERFTFTKNLLSYLKGSFEGEREKLSDKDKKEEFFLTHLRLEEGFERKEGSIAQTKECSFSTACLYPYFN